MPSLGPRDGAVGLLLATTLACAAGTDKAAAVPQTAGFGGACQAAGPGCCPAGHVFEAASASCQPVGLPECATLAADALVQCAPRWCQDAADPGLACATPGAPCPAAGRPCAAAELTQNAGCPAGQYRGATEPACRTAGATAPPVAPVAALPAVQTPTNCFDSAGASRACGAAEPGCPAGQTPVAPGQCAPIAGPAWVCPPGFVAAAATDAGMPACTPDPSACPPDPFGGVADAAKTVFVDAAATATPTGQRAAPFPTVAQAVAALPAGGTVVVGAGQYATAVVTAVPIDLRGRCAALTHVWATPDGPAWRIKGSAASGSAVRGITFSGSHIGLYVDASATAQVSGVFFDHCRQYGMVVAKGGQVAASDIVIADTLPNPQDHAGRAIWLSAGGQLHLTRARLHHNRDVALVAEGAGTVLDAAALVIDATQPQATDGLTGRGMDVSAGAVATLDNVALLGNHETALRATDPGTMVTATRIVAAGTQAALGNGLAGVGVHARSGATVTVDGAVLVGNRMAGVTAVGAGTQVTVHNALIDANGGGAAVGEAGLGVAGYSGAMIQITGSRAHGNSGFGVVANGPGTVLQLGRVVVDGTLAPGPANGFGPGIAVQAGAHVQLAGVRLSANRGNGLAVAESGSSATIAGLVVDVTLPDAATAKPGVGVAVSEGAQLTGTDLRCSGNLGIGVGATSAGTLVQVKRALIDGTRSEGVAGVTGFGVDVILGATVRLSDSRCTDNRGYGVLVSGAGSAADLRGFVVDDTAPRPQVGVRGIGLAVINGGRLWLGGGQVRHNVGSGVAVLGPGSAAQIWDTTIADTVPVAGPLRLGRGLSVENGASLTGWGLAVRANTDSAMTVLAGTATLVGCSLTDSVPNADGSAGSAVFAGKDAVLTLLQCQARHNHMAAVVANQAVLNIGGCVLAQTNPAAALQNTGIGPPFADGLIVQTGTLTTVTDTLLVGNPRAGVLLDNSQAQLSGVLATQCGFGVALQHGGKYQASRTVFSGNSIQNIASDQGLAVPGAPQLAGTDPETD